MNSRIYDALLGRFLQADLYVEDATTLNRYTYVHNNPLASIDPSGLFSLKFKDILKIASVAAISFFLPQTLVKELAFKELLAKVVTGAIVGGIATGSVEGALVGAFSAGVFHGIGAGFENLPADHPLNGRFMGTNFNPPGHALKSTAHGLTGGVVSKVQGGKFIHGFSSAGVTQFFSGGIDHIDGNTDWSPYRVAVASVLGGAVSEISGGKFANGAVTAAFSRAFNDEPAGNDDDSSCSRDPTVCDFLEETRRPQQETVDEAAEAMSTMGDIVEAAAPIGVAGKVRLLKEVLRGAKPGRVTKGRASQFEKAGGFDQAQRAFDALSPSNVRSLSGGGRVG
ncbi:MAG: RHS repeat-associated core domain-containing protein [Spirulinaceae cyanobacterium]